MSSVLHSFVATFLKIVHRVFRDAVQPLLSSQSTHNCAICCKLAAINRIKIQLGTTATEHGH